MCALVSALVNATNSNTESDAISVVAPCTEYPYSLYVSI